MPDQLMSAITILFPIDPIKMQKENFLKESFEGTVKVKKIVIKI